MANIKSFIEKVRSAVLGIEVRDSIADVCEAINIETEEVKYQQECLGETFEGLIINAGNSNAEIVDARGGSTTLRRRLDSTDIKVNNDMITLRNDVTQANANMNDYIKSEFEKMKALLNQTIQATSEYVVLWENANGVCATGTILNLKDSIDNYYDIICVCDFQGYDYNNIVNNVETISLRGINIADTPSLSSKATEFYEIGLRKIDSKNYEITRNNRIVVSSTGARTKENDSEYSKIRKIYAKKKISI